MIVIPKIVGVMSCGVLLCLSLLGNAGSAPAGTKAGESGERVGGQAGREYEHGTWKHSTAQPGERVGGQAGREYEHGRGKDVPAQSGERVGGQAGREYGHAKQEHAAVP